MKNYTFIKHSGIFSCHPDALFIHLSLLHECVLVSHVLLCLSFKSVDVIAIACVSHSNSDLTLLLHHSNHVFCSHGVTVTAPLDQFFLRSSDSSSMRTLFYHLLLVSTNFAWHLQHAPQTNFSGQILHEETNATCHVVLHFVSQRLSLCEIFGGVVWSNHLGGCDMLRVVALLFQVIRMTEGLMESHAKIIVHSLFNDKSL